MGPTRSPPGKTGRRLDSSSDTANGDRKQAEPVTTAPGKRLFWKLRLRPEDDDEPQDWWFAAIAIPLLAATIGPLANLLSIAALVTSWRAEYPPDNMHDQAAIGFADPRWCIILNACSLVFGFGGNALLMLNFARRVRYIISLPVTIISWYLATGILISIIVAMNKYVPPIRPNQTFTQGFWYAIIATSLYLLSSMLLMINLLGYLLGHYPQHFTLTDHQRTLMLQTMLFFIWLGGGAGIFSKVCGWSFVNALYFCDVTILTVGFGDFSPTNDVARGLTFPFSVGGIVMLGLVVSSIRQFTLDLSQNNIIKRHIEKTRIKTIGRAATASLEFRERRRSVGERSKSAASQGREPQERQLTFGMTEKHRHRESMGRRLTNTVLTVTRIRTKSSNANKPKILLLREEKSRFEAMRAIQRSTRVFKRWYNLCMSVFAFGLLWCVGAVVFWKAENKEQGLTYFQALYFCYVSLLTIGYGDLSPRSNAGKAFFVVWSLLAVPTMTILVGDMGDTLIASFQRGTFTLAEWTVLPKAGIWREFMEKHPWLLLWIQRKAEKRAAAKRIAEGFQTGIEDGDVDEPKTLEQLAEEEPNEHDLARKLALAIRRVANQLREHPPIRYSYEEWVEFTRFIRFSHKTAREVEEDEEEEGLIEWDWIGEDSPMLADQSEAEWVLDRLVESLNRYMKRQRNLLLRRESLVAPQNEAAIYDDDRDIEPTD